MPVESRDSHPHTGFVRALLWEDGGAGGEPTLWIGSESGLWYWPQPPYGPIRQLTRATGGVPRTGWVRALYRVNGTLWIGSETGLWQWPGAPRGIPSPLKAPTGWVRDLYPTSTSGALWVGAQHGL